MFGSSRILLRNGPFIFTVEYMFFALVQFVLLSLLVLAMQSRRLCSLDRKMTTSLVEHYQGDEEIFRVEQRLRYQQIKVPRSPITTTPKQASKRHAASAMGKGPVRVWDLGIAECDRLNLVALLRAPEAKWQRLLIEVIHEIYRGHSMYEGALSKHPQLLEDLLDALRARLAMWTRLNGESDELYTIDWLVALCPEGGYLPTIYRAMVEGRSNFPSLTRYFYAKLTVGDPCAALHIYVQCASLPLLRVLFGHSVAKRLNDMRRISTRGKEQIDSPHLENARARCVFSAARYAQIMRDLLSNEGRSLRDLPYRAEMSFVPRPSRRGDIALRLRREGPAQWRVFGK